jgi:hypothetical protein
MVCCFYNLGGEQNKNSVRSVTLCRLAEHFGARVVCYAVVGEALSQDQQHEAQEFLSRILQQRLKRRGRRK